MDAVRVGLAIQSGVSIVCATCKRYWEGRERGLPEPKCTVKKPCGSPLARMTFPEYDGPMTDFVRWCFVCGARAEVGVRVRQEPRVLGMCRAHVPMLEEVEPVGLKLNGEGLPDIVDRLRGGQTLAQYLGPKEKTLSQLITETEADLAGES